MVKEEIIIKYGKEIFIKMKKYRMDKNKEIYFSIKFCEEFFHKKSPYFIKLFCYHLNNEEIEEIKKYCKLFDIIGLYHKISYTFFTKVFWIQLKII